MVYTPFQMGGGLSANFEQRKVLFTTGCWNVIDAVHNESKEAVSLWILDNELLKKTYPSYADQQTYIQFFMTGIQKARKLRHPHILKILEVQDNTNYFEFTSEPVASCLKSHIGHLDSNDSSYFAFQIADTLSFLHTRAKMVHFNVQPNSIFLTNDLTVKIFGLHWLSPMSDDGIVHPPFKEYTQNLSCPDIHYVPPEVIQGRQCAASTDIFGFGLTFCEMLTGKQLLEVEKKEDYNVTVNPVTKLQGMTSTFFSLLQDCLQPSPNVRPTAERIMNEAAFQTTSVKVLRYLDLIVAKDRKDKFEFFKSLSKVLNGFSQKMVANKIIPILVTECEREKLYAPVIIGPVLEAARNFPMEEFTNNVFMKLAFLTNETRPPQILIAFLQQFDLILENTDPQVHESNVYRIIYSSLRSGDQILVKECLKKLPHVLKGISDKAVTRNVVPLLMKCMERTNDAELVVTILNCLTSCLPKVDNDLYLKYIMPNIHTVWTKFEEPIMIPPLCEMFNAVKGGDTNTMAYAIPFASDIAASSVCDPYYQKSLCSWILFFVTKYKDSRKLDEAADPSPKQVDVSSTEIAALFDPLAQELSITPAQAEFDFTFSSVPLVEPTPVYQQPQLF